MSHLAPNRGRAVATKALPAYEAAPMITRACLEKYPELKEVLQKLKGAISTEEMSRLNYLVEIEGKDVREVAAKFLASSY